MRRQILTVFSAVIIVSLLFPAIAFAEDYTWIDNGDGTCTITSYACSAGDVVIPGTLGGLSVIAIGDYAFDYCYELTSITIPDSVISIGDWAFSGLDNLTAFYVDALNPNYSSIDGVLFNKTQTTLIQCPSGKTGAYVIPDGVIAIEGSAFADCRGLTSITIPDSVISIGGLGSNYYYLDNLTAFYVDALNPNYSSIDGVLFNKTQTTLIQCPSGKTGAYVIPDGVIAIEGSAFADCRGLTSITIPDSVISIGGLDSNYYYYYNDLDNLTAFNVDSLNPNYSSIDGVLFNKTQTTLIRYPRGKTGAYVIPDGVITIEGSAFADCRGLTSITISDSVIAIGDYAFDYCYELTSITIPDSVISIGDRAFNGLDNLTAFNVDSLNPNYSSIDGVLFNKTQTTLIRCPGGKTGAYVIPDGVIAIEDHAFPDCRGLTSITIPDSVISIGGLGSNYYYYYYYYYLENLTAFNVDALNPNYSSIDGVLFNKTQTTLIWCPRGKTGAYVIPDGVITIGDYAFANCRGLTSITIPDSVITIGDRAFNDLRNLISVYFRGNAPALGMDVFSYYYDTTVYYVPGTMGWGATYGGAQTAPWLLIAADLDLNGKVDFSDFAVFATAWHSTKGEPDYNLLCDFVDDNTIDVYDLVIFCENWLEIDTISDHVFNIEMSLSYDYGEGYTSSVPVDYQFDAWMRVDNTIVAGTVQSPSGTVYLAEFELDDGEIWLGVHEWSTALEALSDFSDGDYIFTVIYANDESQSTIIPFYAGDGSPLTVPPRPKMDDPIHGATDVSLSTTFLLDPSNMTNPVWTFGLEYFSIDGRSTALNGDFDDLPNTTTTAGPVDLLPDTEYEVELTSNHLRRATNADGIPYVVDKDSEVEIHFTTVSAP